MKKVILSILDYNGKDQTLACLSSLNHIVEKDIDLEILIIDNYPQKVLEFDTSQFSHLTIKMIKTKENLGFAGGHNIAFDYARKKQADFLIILNNDTEVDKKLIRSLLEAAERHPNAGAIVPKIYFMKGSEFHKDRYTSSDLGKVIWYAGGYMDWNNINGVHIGVDEVDKGQFDTEQETDLMTGCCVMFTRRVIEKLQGFDERYFLYYEDADLNERIKREGLTIVFAPEGKLWHANAGSTGGSGSVLQDYFISRNRMLFGITYASLRTKVALVRESLRLLRHGRVWQKKGIKDYYANKFGRGSFAV